GCECPRLADARPSFLCNTTGLRLRGLLCKLLGTRNTFGSVRFLRWRRVCRFKSFLWSDQPGIESPYPALSSLLGTRSISILVIRFVYGRFFYHPTVLPKEGSNFLKTLFSCEVMRDTVRILHPIRIGVYNGVVGAVLILIKTCYET